MCGHRRKKVPTKMQVTTVSDWHLNSKVSVKFPFSKAWMVAASGWVHMHCPRPLCNSAPLAQLKHKPGLARPTVTYNNTLFSTNKESTAPRHLWPTSTTVHLSVSPPHQLPAPQTNFQPPTPPSSPPSPRKRGAFKPGKGSQRKFSVSLQMSHSLKQDRWWRTKLYSGWY